ncbi:DnaJ domain-containing protein [Azospirillum halopraeferens]|uniref:DnaJ domain-containing protein n=1 Tax=Azospirillum halopraeferens TaxID=34010 RepID=UPI0004243723|nr:DnaJ domain-containing protein [Azospirillum halopraeferens]
MVPLVLLGIALAVGLFLAVRGFVAADPRTLAQTVRYGGVALAGVVLVILTLLGRLGIAMAIAGFLFPIIHYWRTARRQAKAAQGPTAGRTSTVETLFVRMTLDHDSGAMTGTVLHGTLRGRELETLTRDEALDLLDECRRDDPKSAAVLEAWLDRTHADWREAEPEARAGAGAENRTDDRRRRPPPGSGMSVEEAYEILGVSPGATAEQIKEAHRRLMMKVHPDHGGSTYLAAKINQAKDLLLHA